MGPSSSAFCHEVTSEYLLSTPRETTRPIIDHGLDEDQKYFLKELGLGLTDIEKRTRNQRNDRLWYVERKKRLTASNFGRIYKMLDTTNKDGVAKDILYSTFSGTPGTVYGNANEGHAIEQFQKITNKSVSKAGLVVHEYYPFLAASPDGFVRNENALIEVKCPYYARDSQNMTDAINNNLIKFVSFNNGQLKLDKDSHNYFQVQGQLQVTGKDYCYFVVWTPNEMSFQKIGKSQNCWDLMFPKLKEFYLKHMLPEILKKRD